LEEVRPVTKNNQLHFGIDLNHYVNAGWAATVNRRRWVVYIVYVMYLCV